MKKMELDGIYINDRLDASLASYAQKHAESLGRKYWESVDPNRSPFQRDRDRIIHTTAFRRLKGKMQVVSPSKGDHYRNRLTHTIEVAQIARDLARQLFLNEDLAESIALSHDLGHPPFGHAGEKALHQKMKSIGLSFEHNKQSLRIVEFFEPRYQNFPGLNLTQEVREGMQKHSTIFYRDTDQQSTRIYSPHLESQLVDLADSIAYLSADIEDGLRGGFFVLDALKSLGFVSEALSYLSPEERSFRPSLVRSIVRLLMKNLVTNTKTNIELKKIESLSDVQACSDKIIELSLVDQKKVRELKSFLMEYYYQSGSVKIATDSGVRIIHSIFDFLSKSPEVMPQFKTDLPVFTQIADFIAGMTDAFAEEFYQTMVVK